MKYDLVTNDAEQRPPRRPSKPLLRRQKRLGLTVQGHAEKSIEYAIRFGAVVSRAKQTLPHGQFGPWCQSDLGLKESRCAAYRRLFEAAPDLEKAREWARDNGHPRASTHSVQGLLRIVEEWRTATGVKQPSKRKAKSGVKVITRKSGNDVEIQRDVTHFHDTFPPQIVGAAENLVQAILDYKSATGVDLWDSVQDYITTAVTSRSIHTCGTPQLCIPSGEEWNPEEDDDDDVHESHREPVEAASPVAASMNTVPEAIHNEHATLVLEQFETPLERRLRLRKQRR